MSAKDVAGKGDAGLMRSLDQAGAPPLLGRKSVLMGMLTSGFVVANVAQPSAAIAGTVKPPPIAATQPAYALKWTPSTVYTRGQQVISPNNDGVSANVAHTSSAAYATETAKWSLSSTYAVRDGQTYNVRDYGAAGDGIANDTTAIQAALEAARMEGVKRGGTVFIPAGKYRITVPLKLYTSVSVVGQGWSTDTTWYNTSALIADPAFVGSAMLMLDADGGTVSSPPGPDMSWHHGIIEKLAFKGNGITGPHGLNPSWNGEASTIRNCSFLQCNSGIYLTSIQASCTLEAVSMFECAIGLNCDGIAGTVRALGLSGDNNTSLVRVKGGRNANVTITSLKGESYVTGKDDPLIDIVDLEGGAFTLLGGWADTSAPRKQVIKVSQPGGSGNRPRILIVGFDCNNRYTNLLNDVFDNKQIVAGDSLGFPFIAYNLNLGVLGTGELSLGYGRAISEVSWDGTPMKLVSSMGDDGTLFHAGLGGSGGKLVSSDGVNTLMQWRSHACRPMRRAVGRCIGGHPRACSHR